MDGLTCSFNPFSSKTLRGGILFPKLPIRPLETCPLCGNEFKPKNRLQRFCSVKCQKHVNSRSETTKRCIMEWKKKRRKLRKLILKQAIKELNHILGTWEKRQVTIGNYVGTHAPSTDLRIIKVNGQERIRAAVWLENNFCLTQRHLEACLT
jgi:hypothetical protein